jgi:tRNA A-37 threonylcarbamoyl transferase component Bud32
MADRTPDATDRAVDDTIARLNAALAGRYTVQQLVGAGGMASVYLTEDLKHHRSVAMKVLRPELAIALGRERFLREIDIIANLTHPHILPLHDSGVVGDIYYFTMPYLSGESLQDRLDRDGQIPIREAVKLGCEVADALAYAHEHGVVHRDIKPQNIMLEAGHAYVADFGVAHLADGIEPARITATGVSLGTPQYMSPEQIGGARHVDGRSDIYSLGCVLYEMLTGQPPFTGPTFFAVMARQAAESPPRVRVVRPTVSDSLEQVVLEALAKVPADRFQTARELADALTAVSHEQAGARPFTTGDREQERPQPSSTAADAEGTVRVPLALRWAFRVTAAAVALAVFLTLVGLLNIAFYDSELQIPDRFTPTQTNYLVIGARAFAPSLFYAFATIVVLLVLRYVAEGVNRLLQAVPRVKRRLNDTGQSISRQTGRILRAAQPTGVAHVFFLLAVLVTALGVARYIPLYEALFTADTAYLGCNNRNTLVGLQPLMTVLIAGLAFGWFHVFRWVKERTGELRSVAAPRWGSAGLIVLLTLVMAVPWRLTFLTGQERVRIGSDRGYVLRETDTHLVVYNADQHRTTAYPQPAAAVTRLGVQGNVFEEPAVFASGIQECESVGF